jgi:hypothetical protein
VGAEVTPTWDAAEPILPVEGGWLLLLADAFVLGYALDVGLSLLEKCLRFITGSTLLIGLRNAVAMFVLYGSMLLVSVMVLTLRRPLSIFVRG